MRRGSFVRLKVAQRGRRERKKETAGNVNPRLELKKLTKKTQPQTWRLVLRKNSPGSLLTEIDIGNV